MAAVSGRRLVVIPPVPVWHDGDMLVFDRKFYDGMLKYLEYWDGSVRCIMTAAKGPQPLFGQTKVHPTNCPFEVFVVKAPEDIGPNCFAAGDAVLAAGDQFEQLHIAALCRGMGIPCVYAIEYTPQTRYQIVDLSTKNPLIRARRKLFVWNGERRRLRAFRVASGLQCNGTPAFEEYAAEPNRLLYFDTRVYAQDFVGVEQLQARTQRLGERRPLRIAFSGRLVAMKGVDHLPRVAAALRSLNCPFELTIYGAGELGPALEKEVAQRGLSEVVRLPGAVDFYARLLPDMRERVDLFVCLHRQADPSCTYLETLSCGVPIVGYANRAFSGLLRQADVGWATPMDKAEDAAAVIAHLNANRDELATKSELALGFARSHDFESTFRARISHVQAVTAATPPQ